ncbi:MAG: protein FdrA, partial [Gemmatimonadetes bacterium]|nr:protein FdrA [Gemmatimonadota bacterium]
MIEVTDHRLLEVRRDAYVDSVGLLNVSQEMQDVSDVTWANALMGTPANLELLQDAGFGAGEVEGLRANDLVLAVVAESEDAARRAMDVATESMRGGGPEEAAPAEAAVPRSLEEAAASLGDANIAVVSVPGEYAALEAHKALSAGLHVLLFSDHVPVEDEVTLKRRAADLGLLVMGPGAGTAMLGGAGLGFANAVRPGPVRVVAAAGTGAQEAMTLLHRWGSGVSDVVGVGGRDLS